jgi:hypothetical protein
VSFLTRRRSATISCWSSDVLRFVTSRLTTTTGALRSQPRTVERGTSRSVAMVTSPWRGRALEAGGRNAAAGAKSS